MDVRGENGYKAARRRIQNTHAPPQDAMVPQLRHPYADLLARVDKPGRYVGGEYGAAAPKPDAQARMVLAFPDVYEVGTSHIGTQILYRVVNRDARFSAERVFMPWPDMAALLREKRVPLCSLESATPVARFDVVGVTLQYELTFTNIVHMLDLAHIPRRAAQRDGDHPLVVAGGPVAAQCESVAPFLDAVVLGDGEDSVLRVLEVAARAKAQRWPRRTTWEALAALPHVYVPSLVDRVRVGTRLVPRAPKVTMGRVAALRPEDAAAGPVPAVQAVFDRYSVEIARGCTEGCRFCQAGYLYRPVRERTVEQVRAALESGVTDLGFDEVSLASLSSADHSDITRIVCQLGEEFFARRVAFSVPSLRAYGLSDEELEALAKMRTTGVTLAPEAGSQRLRDVINKNVTEQDVAAAASRFFARGFTRIKLYFMLGLPTETDADLEAIVALARGVLRIGRQVVGRRADVVASVSTFVPKPHTPFEREAMIGLDEIVRRQAVIREAARGTGVVVRTHDARQSVLEGVFSRGDAALADVLERAVDAGAWFDGWEEWFDDAAWERALAGVSVDAYLGPVDTDEVPWQYVDTGVTEAFKRAERAKALAQAVTPPCGVFTSDGVETTFVCHHCGLKCKRGELAVRPVRTPQLPPVEPPRRPRRPRRPDQGAVAIDQRDAACHRYRLELGYLGRQVFIGHLDRVRHLVRGLRRAGFSLWYTQGFHPKPKVEAPQPVPLGTGAVADPFDVYLTAPAPPDAAARLQAALPPDFFVTSFGPVDQGTPKLSRQFSAVEYGLWFDGLDAAAVVERIRSAGSLVVTRRDKQREIAQFLREIRVGDPSRDDRWEQWGLPIPSVVMVIAVAGSGGARPQDYLEAVGVDDAACARFVARGRWLE